VTQTNPNDGGHGGRIIKLVAACGVAGCVLSLISKYVPAVHPAAGPGGAVIALIGGALFGWLAESWGWAAGGSALVGMDGTLLGVGSLLVQEALGPGSPAFPGNMYVPINRLKPVFEELVERGRLSTPPRPWLGVHTLEHTGLLVVAGISEGGPADRAGLKRGDVLQALNGEVLDDVAEFYKRLWASGPAGTAITLRMERDNDAFEVTVRTGDRAQYYKYGKD